MPTLILLLSALAILGLPAQRVEAQAFDHSHAQFASVLADAVTNGTVNYATLKAQPHTLDGYLRSVGKVSPAEYSPWSRAEKLAFLINAYNAAVLQLVRDHYPVKSIKRIGGWFENPFRLKFFDLLGQKVSLDDVEHGIIRRDFAEPRVHFALVCAARSCPTLRPEPYVPDRLRTQLNEQGKLFLTDTSKNRFNTEARMLYLSPIFKWFSGDFGGDEDAIVAFVTPFFPGPVQRELTKGPLKVRYTHYDWRLNAPQ